MRIDLIDQMDTYFVMAKNKSIFSIKKPIKTLHIQKNMSFIYKQNYDEDKLDKIDNIFIAYIVPVMNNMNHPALIEGWKQIFDTAAYEKSKPRCKDTINYEMF